ncbi:hypothetical protein CHARACLAT_027734 [Characodon lateralis]|uniref:Uncharacterized protein n=1 Tax=Characodon lateralis TaxID=208331 RepID=A0ABU7EE32_9TELE|nr:hypothetical protein [Characodon lateralis]
MKQPLNCSNKRSRVITGDSETCYRKKCWSSCSSPAGRSHPCEFQPSLEALPSLRLRQPVCGLYNVNMTVGSKRY